MEKLTVEDVKDLTPEQIVDALNEKNEMIENLDSSCKSWKGLYEYVANQRDELQYTITTAFDMLDITKRVLKQNKK